MEDNFKCKCCSENDVLEFNSGTYKVQKVVDAISQVFKNRLGEILYESLQKLSVNIAPEKNSYYNGRTMTVTYHHSHYFTQGVDCEILKVEGNSWQKGKFKINVSIEFIPDEPEKIESELNNVRQEISNFTQSDFV